MHETLVALGDSSAVIEHPNFGDESDAPPLLHVLPNDHHPLPQLEILNLSFGIHKFDVEGNKKVANGPLNGDSVVVNSLHYDLSVLSELIGAQL